MKVPFALPGFEGKDLQLRIRFFGKPKIIVDDKIVRRVNKRFPLTKADGHIVSVGLRRRLLDPFPNLEVAGHVIEVLPRHPWHVYLWLALPLILIGLGWHLADLFGATLAVVWTLLALYFNAKVMRLVAGWVARYIISGAVLILSALILLVSIIAIPTMRELGRVAEIQAFLLSHEIPEIHNGHHFPSAELAADSTHAITDQYGYPKRVVDKLKLRRLLDMGRIRELDSALVAYQRLFEQDFRYEDFVFDAFGVFADPDSTLEPLFDRWVETMPNSFAGYQARAEYYFGMGSESRGTKWAAETSQEQFAAMEFFFDKAERDCRAVMDRNPQVLRTFEVLMNIARARGDVYIASLIMGHAAKLCPYSFRMRDRFMVNLLPRWGGTYQSMRAFAEESQELADVNPKMKLLRGYAAWDQSRMLVTDSLFDDALSKISEALKLAECPLFLAQRGNVLYYMGRYEEAIPDYDRALLNDPSHAEYMVDKARCLYELSRFDESAAMLNEADATEPWNSELARFRKWVVTALVYDGYQYFKANNFPQAITFYNSALSFDPRYSKAYLFRGVANIQQGELDVAASDFKQAIALNPRDFESYRMLDWVLAHYGDWDGIINYWTQYIKLAPTDGRAYGERGGAYFHKPDYAAALKDAETACSMGVNDACGQISVIKSRMEQ
jgi:tetratricopeptide (TPR) repeat protein